MIHFKKIATIFLLILTIEVHSESVVSEEVVKPVSPVELEVMEMINYKSGISIEEATAIFSGAGKCYYINVFLKEALERKGGDPDLIKMADMGLRLTYNSVQALITSGDTKYLKLTSLFKSSIMEMENQIFAYESVAPEIDISRKGYLTQYSMACNLEFQKLIMSIDTE